MKKKKKTLESKGIFNILLSQDWELLIGFVLVMLQVWCFFVKALDQTNKPLCYVWFSF